MILKLSILTLSLITIASVKCLNNGLARTPPMGWISWERFTCTIDCVTYPHKCINEHLYKSIADRIVSEGYQKVGYEYIDIDDCWSEKKRDPITNRLVPDRKRFPNGIKALADYMHSKGLKLGIYGDVGPVTCGGYPAQNGNGSYDYYALDAQTFAEWGIDSLKFDGCNEDVTKFDYLYPKMGQSLNTTGRKMIFSCEWAMYQFYHGINPNYEAIANTCNLWRILGDMIDKWTSVTWFIDWIAKYQDTLAKYSGPGNFIDPDILVIGDFGLSWDQSRTNLAMWSIWSAPLHMANDLRSIRPEHKKLLQNKKVIAIDQDPLGIMGKRVYGFNSVEVWVKPVVPMVSNTYSYAVVYLNRNEIGDSTFLTFKLSQILPQVSSNITFTVHDLFEDDGDIIGKLKYNDSLTLLVNPTGVRMVKLVPNKTI